MDLLMNDCGSTLDKVNVNTPKLINKGNVMVDDRGVIAPPDGASIADWLVQVFGDSRNLD
jgi:hypothetical protein